MPKSALSNENGNQKRRKSLSDGKMGKCMEFFHALLFIFLSSMVMEDDGNVLGEAGTQSSFYRKAILKSKPATE